MFALLVVVAEVAGRSVTAHVDRALHVTPLAPTSANYYPFVLVALKIVTALACAALLARATRAWAVAAAILVDSRPPVKPIGNSNTSALTGGSAATLSP